MTKAIGLNIVKASAFRRWPVIKAFSLCGNHPFDGWLSFEKTAKALFDGYKLNAVQEAQAEDRILHGQLGKVIVVLD